ncbi:MAG: hypothetical protein RSC43_00395 [Clostridia bacterium]
MIKNMDTDANKYLDLMLDINLLGNGKLSDARIAFMNSFELKTTKDETPYYRLVFSDVSGRIIIGRMFSVENAKEKSKVMETFVQHYVLVDFDVSNFEGSCYIKVTDIQRLRPSIEESLADAQRDVFNKESNDAKDILKAFIQKDISDFPQDSAFISSNMLEAFSIYRSSEIGQGKPGEILKVLCKLYQACKQIGVSHEYLTGFLCVLSMHIASEDNSHRHDDSAMITFHAMVADSCLSAKQESFGGTTVNIIMSYAMMLDNLATNVYASGVLVKSFYDALCVESNMVQALVEVPPDGGVSYGALTLRRA